MTGNLAADWREAKEWDLAFWQEQTPEMRIAALEEMRHRHVGIEDTLHS